MELGQLLSELLSEGFCVDLSPNINSLSHELLGKSGYILGEPALL